MNNLRNHYRLKKQIDVYWKVDETKLAQKGKIHDLSLAGLKFETGRGFTPKEDVVFFLDCPDIPALPRRAKLKWFKSASIQGSYMCGASFVKDKGIEFGPAWKAWMDENISQLGDAQDHKILGKYLDHDQD
jgi:hypothetical protein